MPYIAANGTAMYGDYSMLVSILIWMGSGAGSGWDMGCDLEGLFGWAFGQGIIGSSFGVMRHDPQARHI